MGKHLLASLIGFAAVLLGATALVNAVCAGGNCLSPYGAYCVLSSYPSHVPVGGSSEITVSYFNTFYPVGFSAVNCGNGLVMYAWNCGGRTGNCYTQCPYNAPGAYTVTAFAGGISCQPTIVYASSAAPSATPTPAPTATPRPTLIPSPAVRYPRCSVETLPSYIYGAGASSIKIPYFDLSNAPNAATIICGNGEIVYGSCQDATQSGLHQGNCVGSCAYAAPVRYPYAYSVDAVVGGVQCAAGTVSLLAPQAMPTPTVTALPNGALVVKVLKEDGINPLWGATVRVPGRGDFVTNYAGEVEVGELDAGSYVLTISADEYATQSVTAVVRGGETTRITVVMRLLPASCAVAASPASIFEGEATNVSVSYNNLNLMPRSVSVNCGNGATTQAQCNGGYSGSCSGGSCAYASAGTYSLTANAAGAQCASAAVTVSHRTTTGALLVRVTNYASGAAVAGARVDLYQQTVPRQTPRGTFYTNAFGEALAQDLPAGDYVAEVSANGYALQRASARVSAGSTQTLAVCLQGGAGGSGAACSVAITPNSLSVNQSGSVSVDYSSFATDPRSVIVNCGNGLTTQAQCTATAAGSGAGHCSGGSCAYASAGAFVLNSQIVDKQCSSAIANVASGSGDELSLQALEASKTAYGGEKTCFALLLRNSGESRGAVELDASASSSNDWEMSFSPNDNFYVAPHEIKTIDFCIDIPEAESATVTYTINARSPINDATASVTLRALGSSDFSLDYNGCFSVDANKGWVTRVVQLTNDAEDGNYEVEFESNDLGAEADAIYGFEKGETRDVVIRMSTEGLENQNYYLDFKLRKKTDNAEQGPVVFQQTLCVRPSGTGAGDVTLSPSSLSVGRGASQTATVRVKNNGDYSASFYVSALKKTGLTVAANPQYLNLDAGDEGVSTITITADSDAPLGAVSVPIRVYNSHEGGYYDGGYEAEFDCGNGETRTAQCGSGEGSCSVSCSYDSTGYFTPSAVLHGNSCTSQVRVLDYYPSNSLVLRAETPFIATSGTSVIHIDYYGLSGGYSGNAPIITNVEIDARDTSADVYWNTDTAADSRIDFSLVNGANPRSVTRSEYVNSHDVLLTGLTPNTAYVFNVTSCDSSDRCSSDTGFLLQTENSSSSFASREVPASLTSQQNVLYFDTTRTFRIDCGNGRTQTVSCSGDTGSCDASCYYPDTGTFTVTASIDGASTTTYPARVVVGSTASEVCYLTNDPQTIRDGESSTIKMNYYGMVSYNYNYDEYYSTGLVDSQTLLVNIVATQSVQQQTGGSLVTQRLEIDAAAIRASPGTRTSVPVTIRNKNYYDIPSLIVYADSLPSGVTATALTPFSLPAGEEKTVVLQFDVGGAVAGGNYDIALHAESAIAQAPVKSVRLSVSGAAGEAAATVSEPQTAIQRGDNRFEITLNFTIQNDALEAKTLSAAIEGLPQNWTYGMNPLTAQLAANETKQFAATIFVPLAAFDSYKEYPATLAIADDVGKTKRVPLVINKGGASILGGFFTALGGDYGLFALLIVLVAGGAALLYVAELNARKTGKADKTKAKQ